MSKKNRQPYSKSAPAKPVPVAASPAHAVEQPVHERDSLEQAGVDQSPAGQSLADQQAVDRSVHEQAPVVHAFKPERVAAPQTDIRGVLIQLAGARLLLPNATIAEVLSYAPPEPMEATPEWLMGKIRWRGWQLPLVAFAEMAGIGKEPAGLGSKVVVLKALGGNAKAPYFAILSQGFPRLVTVSRDGLIADTGTEALPAAVHSLVMLNEDTAFVPDLRAVEDMINDALAQAA